MKALNSFDRSIHPQRVCWASHPLVSPHLGVLKAVARSGLKCSASRQPWDGVGWDGMGCQSGVADLDRPVQWKLWKEQQNDAKVSGTGKVLSEECREVEGLRSGQGVLLRAQLGASRGSKLNKVAALQGGHC